MLPLTTYGNSTIKACRSFKANLREIHVIGLADGGRGLGALSKKAAIAHGLISGLVRCRVDCRSWCARHDTKHCASRIEFARRVTTSCALGQAGTEGPMTDDLVETAHQDYIEVTSKKTGGKIRYLLCPHCRASFDAIGNALTALDECVAHVRTCGASD